MEGLREEGLVKTMGEFLTTYVEDHDVLFRRGNPADFASRLVRTFSLFSLPFVPDSLVEDALKVKCLYGLWNTVVDDRIDCDHAGRLYLADTIGVVHQKFSHTLMHATTVAGSLMGDILTRFFCLPRSPHTDAAREFFFLDLFRILNGFTYECISLRNCAATFLEYMEFSTSTIDVRCILDVDLALIQKELHPVTIGNLREIYRIMGTVFRLSNDLATVERETYSERSLNAVVLYGIEKGVLPPNMLYLSDEEKREIYKKCIPGLSQAIKDRITQCNRRAASRISQVTEINLEPVAKAFDLLIERVSGESFRAVDCR